MLIDPLDSQSHLEEGLRQNPKVSMSVVAAHERLEQKLRKLGVEIKPSYNIEPAFGSIPGRPYKRVRLKGHGFLQAE